MDTKFSGTSNASLGRRIGGVFRQYSSARVSFEIIFGHSTNPSGDWPRPPRLWRFLPLRTR
jgi:hypothetical protein